MLGVCIDLNLTWFLRKANSINKANTALHAIRLIKKYFTTSEILQLITSNFYSLLYFNSEIWYLPSLKPARTQWNNLTLYIILVKELPQTRSYNTNTQ